MTKQVSGIATQATQEPGAVTEAKSKREKDVLPLGMKVEESQEELEERLASEREAAVSLPAPKPTRSQPPAAEIVTPEPIHSLDIKLDRHRDFGTCHGMDDSWPVQPKFYQDGLYFNHDGDVIPGKGNYQKRIDEANRPKKMVMMPVEVDDDGNPVYPQRQKKSRIVGAPSNEGPPLGIDVFKWARNELDPPVPFGDIRREVRKLYGDDIRSAHEMRDYLLDGHFMKKRKD